MILKQKLNFKMFFRYYRIGRGVASKLKAGRKILWKPNSIINISFHGRKNYKSPVIKAIDDWQKYINLKFKIVERGDVRIGFYDDHAFSFLGQINLLFFSGLTMNIYPANEEEMYETALHEFGHVLGLEHEHQHPQANFGFDKEGLKKWGAKIQLTREELKNSIKPLKENNKNQLVLTPFDKDSIMMYDLPGYVFKNKKSLKKNKKLSDGDKNIVKILYPK